MFELTDDNEMTDEDVYREMDRFLADIAKALKDGAGEEDISGHLRQDFGYQAKILCLYDARLGNKITETGREIIREMLARPVSLDITPMKQRN